MAREFKGGRVAGFTPLTDQVIKDLCLDLDYLFTIDDVKKIVGHEVAAKGVLKIIQQEYEDITDEI